MLNLILFNKHLIDKKNKKKGVALIMVRCRALVFKELHTKRQSILPMGSPIAGFFLGGGIGCELTFDTSSAFCVVAPSGVL